MQSTGLDVIDSPKVPTGAAALAKGLDILYLIGSSPHPLRFKEIQGRSGLPKPTLARILRALIAYRLVGHDEENNHYCLGARFLELAHRAWEAFDLRSASTAELERLMASTDETVVVCQLAGNAIQYLDDRSPGGLSVQIEQGRRAPLHCTAGGKAILAFLPSNLKRATIDAMSFDKHTPGTIGDAEAFTSDLALTQARGYAISIEEHLAGVSSVAAPVSGPNGVPVGAIVVLGPSTRFDADRLHATGRDLMAAARRITGIAGAVALSTRPRPRVETLTQDTMQCVLESGAQLGEGPIWSVVGKCLYWVDILEPAVHRFDPATGENRSCALPKLVSAVVPTESGGLIAATQDGLERLDFDKARLSPFADPEPGMPANRLNDAKCDSAGRLWVGSMRLDATRTNGSLYRVDEKGRTTVLETGFTVTNGMGWSPDDTTFYFVDTVPGHIYAYDFEPGTGAISNRRVFASIPKEEGRPDGLTVDSEGTVWCAIWDGWRVDRFAPDGRRLESLAVPVPRPTSVAFGGADLETLFITTARVRLPAETLAEAPNSGDLFAIQTGTRGLAPELFRG